MDERCNGHSSAAARQERIGSVLAEILAMCGSRPALAFGAWHLAVRVDSVCTDCGHQLTSHQLGELEGWPCQAPRCRCDGFVMDDR